MADSGGFFLTGSGKYPASIAKSSKRQGLDRIRSGKNISENTGQPEKAAVLHDERSRHFLRAEVFSDGQVPDPDGCGAIIRDTGNTKSDLCKIDQQIVAVQFNLRQQLQSLGCKHLMKIFAGGTLWSEHQDGIIQKIFHGKRRFAHGEIVRICHEDIPEFQHSLKLGVGRKPGIRVVGDDQLSLAVFQSSAHPMEVLLMILIRTSG